MTIDLKPEEHSILIEVLDTVSGNLYKDGSRLRERAIQWLFNMDGPEHRALNTVRAKLKESWN